jgi:hypothetical protein
VILKNFSVILIRIPRHSLFRTTSDEDALRADVDPGNAQGDTMPDENLAPDGCCTAGVPLFGVCNAPDLDNNGVPIDAAQALCNALGYESGVLDKDIWRFN